MHRLFAGLVLSLVAASLAVTWVTDAGADPIPACADITNVDARYAARTTNTGTLQADITLADHACPAVLYRLVILDANGTNQLSNVPHHGDAHSSHLRFNQAVDNTASGVCIYVTTEQPIDAVLDRAPASGCHTVSGSSSNGGFGVLTSFSG